ncbi:MAG: hypothetical protein J5584_10635 [Clostridia bacterium]|nr:hypothetical protein [Clostridia bacterium]
MKFFRKIKLMFRKKELLTIAGIVLITICIIAAGVFMLSDDSFTRLSLKGIEILGITIPTPLLGGIIIIAALIGSGIIIKNVIADHNGVEYASLIRAVKKLGDTDSIGNVLASLPKSKNTKRCEMRINDEYLFYKDSSQATVIGVKNIVSVEMDTATAPKKGTDYLVRVKYTENIDGPLYLNGGTKTVNKSISINSTKKKYINLYNEIVAHLSTEEKKPEEKAARPKEMTPDESYIRSISKNPLMMPYDTPEKGYYYQYSIILAARPYGWSYMTGTANYMASADLDNVSNLIIEDPDAKQKTELIEQYRESGVSIKDFMPLKEEHGMLTICGISRALGKPVRITWYNQINRFNIVSTETNEVLIRGYAESIIRRNFGTQDNMKLAKTGE